jgi:hypothetical protein
MRTVVRTEWAILFKNSSPLSSDKASLLPPRATSDNLGRYVHLAASAFWEIGTEKSASLL